MACIKKTQDGGYILAATTTSNNGDVHGNHGSDDVWIVKLNSNGDTLWTKSYGGSSYDQANYIETTPDGGYIVAATSYSNDGDVHSKFNKNDYFSSFDDIWILKLNSSGDTIWTRCYGGSNYDEVNTVKPTPDGGYVFAGVTYSVDGDVTGNHYSDLWIVKINSAGNILWAKCYGGSWYENAYSINLTNDGGYIAAGYATSDDGDVHGHHAPSNPDEQVTDAWVIKINNAGDTIWTKCLGGTNYDWFTSLQLTDDGGYILAGTTNSDDGDVHGGHGKYDNWLVKLNDSGDTVWTKCYGGSDDDIPNSIQLSNKDFIVAGYTRSNDNDVHNKHEDADIWLLKVNENSDTIWTKCFGGNKADYANSLEKTSDGNIIVAGSSASDDADVSGNQGSYDGWVIKLEDNILSVRFLNFTASLQQNTVQLNWKTASETNTARFNVQRSVNGTVFKTIGFIAGKNNNNTSSYSYLDNISIIQASRIYYRLQETDKDGKITYTNIIAINIDVPIVVKPNPAKNKVYMQGRNILWVNVLNASGRLVIRQKPEADNSINISNLATGIYIVQLIGLGNNIATCKLIVE